MRREKWARAINCSRGTENSLRQDEKCKKEKSKRQKGERVVSYSLGRVTSGKLVYNEVNKVKSIND